MMPIVQTVRIAGPAGDICVHVQGPSKGPVIVMGHSILSSSMMWQTQAALLSETGWRVLRVDTRGHGASQGSPLPTHMDDLVADTIAVLDAFNIGQAHYVGLSLGGMSGFGLGIQHSERVLSLCLCDARADMPEPLVSVWNDRIAQARESGCRRLSVSTTERWFGKPYLEANPDIASTFQDTVAATSIDGFVGCANAIQTLNYLPKVHTISTPTTMIVGANDGPMLDAMRALQPLIAGSVVEVIPNAGHLPNIDQSITFNAALMRHFFATPVWSVY